MKIIDLEVYVVDPTGEGVAERGWTFVHVRTDEGVDGWGEASNYPGNGSLIVGEAIRRLAPFVVGLDAADINRVWHTLFRKAAYLGPRGLPTAVISGIDIALWDIKGKALGRPIYDLLGGKLRDTVPLYANGWFDGCATPDEYAAAAKQTVAAGHTALKCDPFLEMLPFHTAYLNGQISAAGEELGVGIIAAMREAVGPSIEILIDAHGHYNVPTAVRLAKRLEPYRIGWFEEPTPPESLAALRSVREQVGVPICVGERLYTRWDFLPILEQRLADYIMPDVVWTGGISELVRIASLAEAYHVPISPHNAMGPLQIVAGGQAMLTIPNFYRLEHSLHRIPSYQRCLDRPIELVGDALHLSERPGLGVELDLDFLRANPVLGWSNG
ncbi:MAG: mandelate racemase/muconate lactonizing enzyme family protein [Chloroflexi bacterium]|nr:mandelate racemase/muconate lactonizing enzyme family protein [Chloroflexota bacterium]